MRRLSCLPQGQGVLTAAAGRRDSVRVGVGVGVRVGVGVGVDEVAGSVVHRIKQGEGRTQTPECDAVNSRCDAA